MAYLANLGERQRGLSKLLQFVPLEECKDKKCGDCASQYTGDALGHFSLEFHRTVFGIPDVLARRHAARLARQNKENHQYLNTRLRLYGDAIRAKWTKLSGEKRKALILQVQPNLYTEKSAIWRTIFRMDGSIKELPFRWALDTDGIARNLPQGSHPSDNDQVITLYDPKYHNALLISWFNFDMLKDDPMRFLSLLHYRTTFKLEDWVPFDMVQMSLAFEMQYLKQKFNDNSLILHGDRYGELVPYNREDAHSYTTVGYPRGILVLEAQSVIFTFLRKMVDQLAVDGSSRQGNAAWTALTTAGFKTSSEVEFWSANANAPFSAPPLFDPEKALSRAKAQLVAAEDHFRYMQTDPAYLHALLKKQRLGEVFGKCSEDVKWCMQAYETMFEPIRHIVNLRNVIDEMENILRLYDNCRDQIHMGQRLPEEYDRAMSALEFLCTNYYERERHELDSIMRLKCPGFARNYNFAGRNAEGAAETRLKCTPGTPGGLEMVRYKIVDEAYFRDDPLHFYLMQLTADPEHSGEEVPPILIGRIEDHLANADAKERQRISQDLYDHLARMCCYYELVLAVRLHRPCPRPFYLTNLSEEDAKRRAWRRFNTIPGEMTDAELKRLATLLKDFYNAPWPTGKRDRAWLDKATETRKRLAAFWLKVRHTYPRAMAGAGYCKQDIQEDVRLYSADQSDDYRSELKMELQAVENLIAEETAKKHGGSSEQMQQCTREDAQMKSFDPAVVKVKLKT